MIIVQVFLVTAIFLCAMRHCAHWHDRGIAKARFSRDGSRQTAARPNMMRNATFRSASSHVFARAWHGERSARRNHAKQLGRRRATCL
jgi:hypothetical protein